MWHVRRATLLFLTASLFLGVTGCGGGSGPKTVTPESDTPTPTPSSAIPTPSPAPTPTQQPLSPFEKAPVVKVTRKWMAGVATSINDNDQSMAATAPFSTGNPARFASYVRREFGLYYPGPLPFTPVGTKVSGGVASIPICLWTAGWGQKRATKLPAERRTIQPVTVSLKKSAGAWKVDGLVTRTGNCEDVPVKGVAW